jgi:basic amino acid/polyamine antiporter, APA family
MSSSPSLRRDLGVLDAVAIGVGAIVGAGIFVVTGIAAGIAGPSFLVGLLIAGIAAACNALSSAELAALYPESGGTYEYGYRLLNPAAGFSAGWMFLASKLAAGGTVALGFGGYVAGLLPSVPPKIAAVVAVILLAIFNWLGIRKAGRLNIGIVAITVVALLSFVVAGIPHFDSANLEPFAPAGLPGILESAALLFFAYTGYARIATLGEEVRDPARTIPRAIIITIAIAAVLYFAVAIVAVGGVGAESLANGASPLQRAARSFGSPGIALAIGIGAATAMLGVLLSQMLGISRMMFAMARRGDLPRPLEHLHPRSAVPDYGIILCASIMLLLVLFGTLEWILGAATFTILLYYAIANICALRLPAAQRLFHPIVPAVGLIACLALAFASSPTSIVTGVALLGIGFLFRFVVLRFGSSSSKEEI